MGDKLKVVAVKNGFVVRPADSENEMFYRDMFVFSSAEELADWFQVWGSKYDKETD